MVLYRPDRKRKDNRLGHCIAQFSDNIIYYMWCALRIQYYDLCKNKFPIWSKKTTRETQDIKKRLSLKKQELLGYALSNNKYLILKDLTVN